MRRRRWANTTSTKRSGHGKEVDGNEIANVVVEKGLPGLTRRSTLSGQESRHGSFGDLETELQQFSMDAGRAPKRVSCGHLPDQGSNLRASLGSTAALLPGNPGPKETEASPMPGDDGLGFYDDQHLAPVLPALGEQNPKETIGLS